MKYLFTSILCLSLSIKLTEVRSQDTLTVMSYNVLNYGDGCQGGNSTLHAYLRTIIRFANPDLLGLVKVENGPVSSQGFADSINIYALNAVFPNRFNHCPYTNVAGDTKTSLLYYNTNKLVFQSIKTIVADISDFNLYKFYYKNDPNLATTNDTTFLYVVLNHTQSGTSSSSRDLQMSQVSSAIQARFKHLPNMIDMGDFNLHSTTEAGYQTLIAPSDTNFRFYDTPFYPDQVISYPALWESNPAPYSKYMTTSTRLSATEPNPCGTSGGAKDWFDHILISPWIVQNANYISYLPNSYQTIGNDGQRFGISENDSSSVKNTSAPANVVEALYQFSNKYPITLKLILNPNATGVSPADPEKNTVTAIENNTLKNTLTVANPIGNEISITVKDQSLQQPATLKLYDVYGRELKNMAILLTSGLVQIPVQLDNGIYFLTLQTAQGIYQTSLLKE